MSGTREESQRIYNVPWRFTDIPATWKHEEKDEETGMERDSGVKVQENARIAAEQERAVEKFPSEFFLRFRESEGAGG